MSGLERKVLLSESKRSSRLGSPRSSRPSSNQPSRSPSRSRLGSHLHSDGEDEYTSNAFLSPKLAPDSLADDLEKLLLSSSSDEAEEDTKAPAHRDKFSEGIEMLTADRRTTSLEAREKALIDILSVISMKYEPQKIDEMVCLLLTKTFMTARSEIEALLSVQAIFCAAAVDIDSCFEPLTTSVLSRLFEQLSNTDTSVSARANLTIGYSLLQYTVNYGSGGFKVGEIIESLVELASECSSEESPIASAAILGAGLLTTTAPHPNTVIDDYLPVFIDYLDNAAHDIKLAAGKVIGLYYQIYQYDEEGGSDDEDAVDGIPFIDHGELERQLRDLISDSSKHIGKKDKRERKSLFRDVLSTIEAFSTAEKRKAVTSEDLLITHLKLSRSKSLSIDSWAKLLLVQHYKWAYGACIHTQIANNPFIKETVQDASYALNNGYSYDVGGDDSDTEVSIPGGAADLRNQQARATLERQRQIKTERWEKQVSQGTLAT